MIGQLFGKLIVIERGVTKNSDGTLKWLCQCDCGNKKEIARSNLVKLKNSTKSCGCLHQQHGMTGTPEYQAWTSMHRRCTSPLDARYADYGGRGIAVCEEWSLFETFFKDVGIRPSIEHSIDRVNNNLGYYKDNVKWSTPEEQMRNKQNTRFLTVDDVTKSLQDWCAALQLNPKTVSTRLCRGWSDRAALEL